MSTEQKGPLSAQQCADFFNAQYSDVQQLFDQWVNDPSYPEAEKGYDALLKGLACYYLIIDDHRHKMADSKVFEIVNMLTKTASYLRAALMLLRMGHLAECQSILRQVAEGCNLLILLRCDPESLDRYIKSDDRSRSVDFDVNAVRRKIRLIDEYDLFSEYPYSAVSQLATHFSTSSVWHNTFVPKPTGEMAQYQRSLTLLGLALTVCSCLMFLQNALWLLRYSFGGTPIEEVIKALNEASEGLSKLTGLLAPENKGDWGTRQRVPNERLKQAPELDDGSSHRLPFGRPLGCNYHL